MGFLALLGAAFALLGFAVGRWAVVVPAAVAMPLYVLGRVEGWWGHGVGDGWEVGLVGLTVVATAGTAIGVAVRKSRARSS